MQKGNMRDGESETPVERNLEVLLLHAEMQLGKQKLSWSSNQQKMTNIAKKAVIGMLQVGVQGSCRCAAEWGWKVNQKPPQKRQKCSVPSLPEF